MTAEPQQPLFRPEVAEARKRHVHGEIVLSQPVRAHALVLLLVAIVAILATWVVLGSYSRTEVARGIIVTDIPSAKILAIRPGQISELLVREGELVEAGQRLVSIRVEQAGEGGGSAVADSLTALEAQRGLTQRQEQFAGQRAASERARMAATLAGLAQQRSDLAGQIKIQREMLASAEGLLTGVEDVVKRGFVSKLELERRRGAVLNTRQQLAQLEQQVNAIAAEESRGRAELTRVGVDAGSEVVAARSSAQTLAGQRAQLGAERAYTITAPIAGRVTTLQAGVGRPADSTTPLMTIIPEGAKLHAQIYAPTRAIGFVKPEQEVRLLYDAFPYQRFGSFEGKIGQVSRTVLDPRDVDAPLKIEEPVYRVTVILNEQTVRAYGENLQLQPGMSLTANLVLDRRSFLDWLLEPLNAPLISCMGGTRFSTHHLGHCFDIVDQLQSAARIHCRDEPVPSVDPFGLSRPASRRELDRTPA